MPSGYWSPSSILVRQDAGPARSLDANVGYSTGEGFRVEGAWEHRNLFRPEGAVRVAAVLGTNEQSAGARLRFNNWNLRDQALLLQLDAGRRDFAAFEGYTVRLNQEKLGYGETVIVHVTLDSHSDATLEKFGEALAAIPEIQEACLVSGEYDYFLRIAVRDTKDYERLLRERLYKIPGIRHSKSSFVLRSLKHDDLPI